MISALLLFLEKQGGAQLEVWAGWIHAGVLVILLLAWAWPLRYVLIELLNAKKRVWAPTWLCPACGHPNPSTRLSCQRCEEGAGFRFWRIFRDSPGGVRFRKILALFALSLRITGAVIFYVATFLAAYRFRFFSFEQKPLQELLAALAMLLLLATLYYLRRALGWRLGSPVARFTDLAAAVFLGGVFLGVWVLWAAAPLVRGLPLAAFAVTPDGVVRLGTHRPRLAQAPLNPDTGAVIVPVTYGRWTWPLLHIDQTFVVKVATQPVVTWVGGRVVERLSKRWSSDEPQRARLVVLRQELEATPPGRYEVFKAERGEGLILRESRHVVDR